MARLRLLMDDAAAAAPAPAPFPDEVFSAASTHHLRSISTLVLAIAVVLVFLAALTLVVGFIYYRKSRRRKEFMDACSQQLDTDAMLKKTASNESWPPMEISAPAIVPTKAPATWPPMPISPPAIVPTAAPVMSAPTPPQESWDQEPQPFTYAELQAATRNFSDLTVGKRKFGNMYKGIIHGKATAVEELEYRTEYGEEMFRNQIVTSKKVRSRYLLQLLGYCTEEDRRLLVYEYMTNGTLHEHLFPAHGSGQQHVMLDWETRVKIALDVAKGVEYLHEHMNPPILHRDITSYNILLDEQLNAKLYSLGIAKVGSYETNASVETRVMGDLLFIAPEYVTTCHLTKRSDVFSFGLVLLELMTGQMVVDATRPKQEKFLVDRVWALQQRGVSISVMVDPALEGQYDMKELRQFAHIARKCVECDPEDRPHITRVVRSLTQILLQRSAAPSADHQQQQQQQEDAS